MKNRKSFDGFSRCVLSARSGMGTKGVGGRGCVSFIRLAYYEYYEPTNRESLGKKEIMFVGDKLDDKFCFSGLSKFCIVLSITMWKKDNLRDNGLR